MPTHADIKTVAYLDPILDYAESRLNCRLTPSGKYRYRGHCPFHADTKDSFRVYVDGNSVVRFHCFGACKGDWDIYDVIQLREKCSFNHAQRNWAQYLGIQDVTFQQGTGQNVPDPNAEPEPDNTVGFIEPTGPDDQIKATLAEATGFYNALLLSNPDKFEKVFRYLEKRGVERPNIERFRIGYTQHMLTKNMAAEPSYRPSWTALKKTF
jgi:DNA primase